MSKWILTIDRKPPSPLAAAKGDPFFAGPAGSFLLFSPPLFAIIQEDRQKGGQAGAFVGCHCVFILRGDPAAVPAAYGKLALLGCRRSGRHWHLHSAAAVTVQLQALSVLSGPHYPVHGVRTVVRSGLERSCVRPRPGKVRGNPAFFRHGVRLAGGHRFRLASHGTPEGCPGRKGHLLSER